MGQNLCVDYSIVVEGETVGAVSLRRSDTLAAARCEIDGDGLPVPTDYRFVLPNGAPVAHSQEGKRTVGASAGDGDRIFLKAGPLEDLRECLGPLHHLDEVLIAEQARRFVEGTRGWAFDRFDEWVKAGPSDLHRVFVLTGHAGVGKTGIMCKLARDRRDVVVARHFCRHDDARRSNPRAMLLSIAYQLAVSFPEYRQRLGSHILRHKLSRSKLMGGEYDSVTIFTELFENLLDDLDIEVQAERHVILIDAIDECDHSGSNRCGILECIRKHFKNLPPWLGVFITTRPEVPIKEKLKLFDPIEIQPSSLNNLADLKIFFDALLDEDSIKGRLHAVNVRQAVETLVAKSRGLFIYAVMIADAIRYEKGPITQELLIGFPDGLDGFYQEQMERAFPNTDKCLAWDVVKLVVAAVEPLHVELVERLTSSTEEQCRDAVQELSRFFPVQDQQILVYHKSLEDWLVSNERSESRYHIRLDDVEERLAKGCLKILKEAGIFSGQKAGIKPTYVNEAVVQYPLKHGVQHLLSSGMQEEARRLLLEVGWLVARTESGDCLGIVQDCRLFDDGDRVIELLGRAISLAQRTLLQNPRQLAGQLVGRMTGPADSRGGENLDVRQEILHLVERLKFYDYGYSWWCPISSTWDPANSPCLRVMAGHSSSVRCVRWSHDGESVVAGSSNGTVLVWAGETGECLLALKGEKDIGKVNGIAWSHDDERIACTFSGRGKIRIFDVATGEYTELQADNKFWGYRSVAWSPNDQHIAVGMGEDVLILDATTGNCMNVVDEGEGAIVSSVAWSHNGLSMAVAVDHAVKIFGVELATSRMIQPAVMLEEHTKKVNAVSWSHDDKMLLSASDDGFLRIWSSDTAKCLQVLSKGFLGPLRSAEWSNDDKMIVAGLRRNAVQVWDVVSGRCTHVLRGHTGVVLSVGWSPTARKVVSAGADHTVRVWDVASDLSMRGNEGHSGFICCEAWSPDGRCFVTAGVDKNIRVWEVNTGKTVNLLWGHSGRVNCVAFSHDGALLASGSSDVRVWQMTGSAGGRDELCLHVLKGHTGAVRSVAWTTDDLFLASGAHDVRIWDVKVGVCTKVFTDENNESNVYSLAWSPDKEYMVCASAGQIKFWDVDEGKCTRIVKEQAGVKLLAYSDDGRNLLYTTAKNRSFYFIDVSSGECTQVLFSRSEVHAELSRLGFTPVTKEFRFSGMGCDSERVDMNRFGVFGHHACGISGHVVRFFTLFERHRSKSEGNKIAFLQSDPLVYKDEPSGELHPLPRLNFGRERELIRQCLADASRDIELCFDAATTKALQDAVINRVDCVHISCHGAPTYLLLEDGRGGAHFLDDGMLTDLYPHRSDAGKTKAPHKLAVISACFSGYLSNIFVNAGVDHVVCCEHNAELADEAANVFMKSFYMALAVGHTVKVSFDMGRQAVASGPFVLDAAKEKGKFMLLPEHGSHEEAIFYARLLPEWKKCTTSQLLLPRPAHIVSDRQVGIYVLLTKLLKSSFVTVVGTNPHERSSLAAAVCHYINDRAGTTEIDIDAVLHIEAKQIEEMGVSCVSLLHQQLASTGVIDVPNKGSTESNNWRVQDLVASLKGSKLLVFIDSHSNENGSLHGFLELLLPLSDHFKILLTAESPIGNPKYDSYEEVYEVGCMHN